jgi:hypothetical protein
MAKSSINFQKSKGHSYDHNFRKDEPNYLLKPADRLENFYWQNEKTAREIFDEELLSTKRKGGPIPRFENSHWEAVLNLNKNHALEDVQKVARYIEQKFNITCATIAVHRDEGHYKNDKPQYNFHAHITFVTYKDGQQNWRKEKIKPSDLRELQTAVAEILQMERGQENSEAERLSHRQYKKAAQQKEAEKAAISISKTMTEKAAVEVIKATYENEEELLNDKEKSEYIEQLRKQYKGKGLSAEFFRELGALKKDKEAKYTQKELDKAIQKAVEADREKQKPINRREFEQQTAKELKSYAQATEQKPIISPFTQGLIAFLTKDGERIKQLEKVLKERDEQILKVVDKLGISTENLKTYKDYDDGILKAISNLKRENDTLKTQNKALQEQNDTKDKENIDPRQENASAVKFEPLNAPIIPQNNIPGKDYEIIHDRGFEIFDERLNKNELEKEAEKIASYEDVKDENGLIRYGNKRAKVIFRQIDDDGWNWDETEKDITKTFLELVNYHKQLKERQAEQERRPQTTPQRSAKAPRKKDNERDF